MVNLCIRQETPQDFQAVKDVIQAAFEEEPFSDHREYLLVERLRLSSAFIPELSLVAELDGEIVGHILLTKAHISNIGQKKEVLALAPVSVHPLHQRQGIGTSLIKEAHKVARKHDFPAIVLIGHEGYYPRFGYEVASKYHLSFPFNAPDINCMVLPLSPTALQGVRGKVEYDSAFYQ